MEPKLIKEETTAAAAAEKESGYAESPRTRSKANKERCKTPDSPEGARHAAAPLSPTQSSPPPRHNGTASPENNSTTSPEHNQPGSSITRPLVKVKRFLSTLVQFGSDIGPDIGERVRSLVLNLVSSNLSIEEFHHSLQDVTNFPLRPFVLPFLRTHLPLLQREVHSLARANKQSPLQYVRSHDHIVLDSTHSELSEIFEPMTTTTKRRASDSVYENGVNGQHDMPDCLPVKRPALLFAHQVLLPNNPHFFDHHPPQQDTSRGDEEWRNIHVMLNCILSMVEKTKRALTILQQRNSQDLTNEWLRKQDVSVDLKKAANEIMVQAVRQTEDRVAEVRRRAEDAVNDVKRQAVIELQKAVAAAESKANDLVAAERAKMEKLLVEARKHAEMETTGDAGDSSLSPQQQQISCWNCGRKAHETCSGCSVARYCGPFCQHKDWENHHQICAKDKSAARPLRTTTPTTTQQPETAPKFKK